MKKPLLLFITVIAWCGLFAQINTYPNYTSFETEGLCGTSCTGSCNLAGTWRNADQWGFAQAGTDWLSEDGATPSTATGPDVDNTTGTATGKYAYVETSGCNLTTAYLVSDVYDFSALIAPKITFYYHMLGATMGTMHIDVDNTGLGTWTLDVVSPWTDNVNLWQLKTVSLAAYAGNASVRIRIRAETGTSFTSDMGVDDITVFEPLPNDIAVPLVVAGGGCGNSVNTPVTITMVNAGTAPIVLGTEIPVAFDINGTTVLDTFVAPLSYAANDTFTYTFTNGFADLSGPTNVDITAWSYWSPDGATGNDTATVTTIGIPIITNYPYFQDFETGQNGWRINNTNLGTWAFGTPAKTTINSAGSGVNSFVTGGLGTGSYNDLENSYVEGPCFDFSNICDPVISLKVWWNAEFSWDGMNITASSDGGNTWTLVGTFGDPLNWYTDNTVVGTPGGSQEAWSGRNSTSNGSGGWVTARHRLVGLGNLANVKLRLNFGTDGSVTDDGVAFDDVHIFNGTDLGADQTICSPATLTLNADHGNINATYAWSTGETTGSITAATTGTYAVTINDGASCTTSDSVYILVIDANSAVVLGNDTATCGTPVLLDAGYWPQSTYLWSNGATTQTVTASLTNTYAVTVTTPCGTLSDTIDVTVNTPPTVNLGSDVTLCGGSATLNTGIPGATYSWTGGSTSQTLTVSSSGTYSVTVTDANTCTGTDAVDVTINTLPIVNLGSDVTQCGGTATLNAGNAGATYSWTGGSTNQTLTVSSTGTYSVTVTDANTCTGTDAVDVTINTLPTVDLGNDITQCGGSTTLDAGNAGATYSWTGGSTNQTLTVSSTGTYSVTVTDANTCTGTDAVDVTINLLPIVDLGNDVTQCGGSTALDAGNAGATYLWNDGTTTQTLTTQVSDTYSVTVTDANSCTGTDAVDVTINTTPTVDLGNDVTQCGGTATLDAGITGATYAWTGGSPNQTLTVNATGTYSVTVTDANTCTGTDAVDVTINSLPIVDLGNDITQCGGTATLDAGNAGATYLWNDGTTTQTLTTQVSDTYSVTVTDANTCTGTDAVDVTINTIPTVDLGSDVTQCGGTATLDAGNAGATYSWTGGSTNQTLTVQSTGTYSVTITDANTCTATDAVDVTINALPAVDLGNDVSQCGGTTTLDAGNAGATYSWTGGSTDQTLVISASGTYSVTVTDANTCTATDAVDVAINTAPTVDLGNDVTQCGGTTTLDAANAGATYSWTGGTTDQTLVVSATGTYSVTVTDANTCTATDAVDVTINPLPVVDLGNDVTQCGGSATLDAGNTGATYSWTGGTTGQTLIVSATGTYSVTVTDGNTCSATDEVDVAINTAPTVDLGNDVTQCGGSTTLDAGNAGATYSWTGGTSDQTLVVSATGTYSVTVTDANTCTATDAVDVTINTAPTVTFVLTTTTACSDDAAFTLTGGTPAGGTYSGTGVSGGSFNPAAAGVGTHVITYTYTDGNSCTATATQSIDVSICQGIGQTLADMAVSVYPNPSTGIFTLAYNNLPANIQMQVTDVQGRVVSNGQLSATTNKTQIDLSMFDSGVYFLNLRSATETKTIHLVINR